MAPDSGVADCEALVKCRAPWGSGWRQSLAGATLLLSSSPALYSPSRPFSWKASSMHHLCRNPSRALLPGSPTQDRRTGCCAGGSRREQPRLTWALVLLLCAWFRPHWVFLWHLTVFPLRASSSLESAAQFVAGFLPIALADMSVSLSLTGL